MEEISHMCGIFGAFCEKGNLNIEILKKAAETLTHRGPDNQGCWLSEDKKVGLGHTRLSIIDLEGGDQPLKNEDGSIFAVVNGEIYDFERIRAELQANGHRFSSGSDSEVLIHLYEDIGLDALQELRGEYAFIIWDVKNQRLVAARDRFGIKPLYYSIYQERLFLASEIKALLAAGVPAQWDDESLYIACHLPFVPMQNRSLFKRVFQLPPGHVLVANQDQHRLYRYWDFNYPSSEMHTNLSDNEAIETFRYYFDQAVKLRLRADVPVGVYLSGGIDSCSILGTVAKYRGNGVKAFTVSFADEVFDESAVAKEMAEYAGAEFIPCTVTQQALAENFLESIRHCETIVINPHTVAKYMLSKTVRDYGYKVVLTGEGSDEILAGYAHFRQDMLLFTQEHGSSHNLTDSIARLAQQNVISYEVQLDKALDNATINRRLGFIPSWLKVGILASNHIKQLFSKNMYIKHAQLDPYQIFFDDLDLRNQVHGRHVLNQSLYLWSKLILPNYLLCSLGDRMEMAHSVEGRVPFLDHHLVELATTLPISCKIRNMTEKYILREAARPVITDTVYKRKKHPFLAPPSVNKVNQPLFAFINEYILDQLPKIPFFEKQKVADLLKNIRTVPSQERDRFDAVLMMLASTIALQEQFGLS